ncbi:MAG TPA: hypothetical protein VG758_26605 [Hyphomicrobiaceae bacterium]|nr:hypothetical protein [Hyphomicrobiaceae bacterium]
MRQHSDINGNAAVARENIARGANDAQGMHGALGRNGQCAYFGFEALLVVAQRGEAGCGDIGVRSMTRDTQLGEQIVDKQSSVANDADRGNDAAADLGRIDIDLDVGRCWIGHIGSAPVGLLSPPSAQASHR